MIEHPDITRALLTGYPDAEIEISDMRCPYTGRACRYAGNEAYCLGCVMYEEADDET